MVRMTLNELSGELTREEERELEEAERRQPVFDEDSPEMTPQMLAQFRRMDARTVSLRVSPLTLEKARAYGKGDTAFLSRLLDEAINDEALVRKCL